jgi:hypothetical protein
VLARIKSDAAFATSLADKGAVLLEPRGFTDGLNRYNATTPEAIQAKVGNLLERANAIQASPGGKFEDAITAALDENTKVVLAGAPGAFLIDQGMSEAEASAAFGGLLVGTSSSRQSTGGRRVVGSDPNSLSRRSPPW